MFEFEALSTPAACDVFSFGVLLYELAVERPFHFISFCFAVSLLSMLLLLLFSFRTARRATQ